PEPHVQDLARFLTGLGAQVEGIGTNTLTVHGGKLRGAPGVVGPDHIEIGSFIGLAAATNGAITIDGVRAEDLRATLLAFDRLGVRPRLDGAQLVVDDNQERRIRADLGGHVPELEDGPWPQFPADLISIAIVVATQCEGLLLIFEKLFESRLFFVDKLIGMGARIVLCDPHRAVIAGPSPLHGQVVDSPDIRAGMAMLLAAPAARGDWAGRYGLVAGITTREHGFSLGLWSEENVGQVMTRWRAFRAAFHAAFPVTVLSHQIHGSAVRWHDELPDGWLVLDGVDAHATR